MSQTCIHRYWIIVKEKKHLFTNRVILFMCLAAYMPIVEVPYVVYAYYFPMYLNINGIKFRTATAGVDSCLIMVNPMLISFLFVAPIIAIYLALFYCNYYLYHRMHQHISTVSASLGKTASEIKDEKSIMKAAVIQV